MGDGCTHASSRAWSRPGAALTQRRVGKKQRDLVARDRSAATPDANPAATAPPHSHTIRSRLSAETSGAAVEASQPEQRRHTRETGQRLPATTETRGSDTVRGIAGSAAHCEL